MQPDYWITRSEYLTQRDAFSICNPPLWKYESRSSDCAITCLWRALTSKFLKADDCIVVLPAKLPSGPSAALADVEQQLTQRCRDACDEFTRATIDPGLLKHLQCLRFSVSTCKMMNLGSKLSNESLISAFQQLDENKILILHVREQNAGILVRQVGENIHIEAFEASAVSSTVLEAQTLQWDFLSRAISLPRSTFTNASFQDVLATYLEQASKESVAVFKARVMKAGVSVREDRDTGDPSLVTQGLMTICEALGAQVSTPLLRKRVRDEVSFKSGGEGPSRRSPLWLILRMSIERYFHFIFDGEAGRIYYKYFMCLVISRLMFDCMGVIELESVFLLKAKLCRRLAKLVSRPCSSSSRLSEGKFSWLNPNSSFSHAA